MTFLRSSSQGRRGFTLVELLIAVLAFAIVLASINTVFYGALRLRNTTTQTIEKGLPLQMAVAVLKRDLANLVPLGGTLSGELQSTILSGAVAGEVSCQFPTASGNLDSTSPWADVQKVSYALLDSTNQVGSKDLYRLTHRNLLSETTPLTGAQWLLGGVRQVLFSYLSPEAGQWNDSWDSTTEISKLPAAIMVQIQRDSDPDTGYTPDPVEIVVPILVQGRTNAVAQSQTTGGGQ